MTSFSDMIGSHQRFRQHQGEEQLARWKELAGGQEPKVMVVSCVDSRVAPEQILDVGPGELFVLRNVANIVPPYSEAGGSRSAASALEFAVTKLGVTEIVVMGHAACGGVGACLSQAFANAKPGEGGFVGKWVETLNPARERVVAKFGDGPDAAYELELEGVRESIANLRTFPFIRERVEAGTLRLHGAWFGIGEAQVHVMDEQGEFRPA